MSGLRESVAAAFAPDGPLARRDAAFRPRDGQRHLAQAVAQVMAEGGQLVAEAATGVGKTYAYLAPALLSGERVLLSTATKALQDQLFGRDLPRLTEAFGLPVRTALLKGRGSYLCLYRMEMADQLAGADARALQHGLGMVRQWAASTRTGDLAELPRLDERSPVIPLVTSTRENCLGAECPQFKACHVQHARRQALAADVVVINHHLFFADLAIRENGMAELLPTVRIVVFDEAHQLNETGVQFLGRQLSTTQLLELARDLLATGLVQARGLADWRTLAARLELAARALRALAPPARSARRLAWRGPVPDELPASDWHATLHELDQTLAQTVAALQAVADAAPDFARLLERASALHERAQAFAQACPPQLVRWVDLGHALRLVESPLDIAETVRARLLAPPPAPSPAHAPETGDPWAGAAPAEPPAPTSERERAWIFVSATLGDDERLRWFTEPCGLEQARTLRIGSPFDYAAQAALYVPTGIARPADPAHSEQVAAIAADAALRLGGRTLVLTTTLRALQAIGDALRQRLQAAACAPAAGMAAAPPIEVLVQGSLPKRELVQRFRAAGRQGRPGSVLVASASFWEGLDVPGAALQCVVIDKLPFPPPGDPLVQARCQRLEQQGRSAFADYSLPEAAVALKQGAGRLIRHEDDSGVLIICDTRLSQMGYGRRLLAALPPMRRLRSADELADMLEVLARVPLAD